MHYTIGNPQRYNYCADSPSAGWPCDGVISTQTASPLKSESTKGEFDDVKTDAGEREVPFDKRGLTKSALIGRWNAASKHRQPDDLVFCTRKGGPLERRNLLRHIKPPQPNWDSRRP